MFTESVDFHVGAAVTQSVWRPVYLLEERGKEFGSQQGKISFYLFQSVKTDAGAYLASHVMRTGCKPSGA
jgi:hypothetical protein